MPNVYNVSEITNVLSTIIQEQSTLQDIWIYGKTLETLPPNRLTLGDTGCSIDCRNDGKDALFVGLGSKKVYYAYGKVIVNPQKSRYRFAVTKIQPNSPPNSFVDTWSLTEKLKQTIKQLETVQVHGKISSIRKMSGYTLLRLENANFNKRMDGEKIECTIPPGIDPGIVLVPGSAVCVRGQIDIFHRASVYQIKIANANDIMSGPSLEQCECSGCKFCQPPDAKCNQTRNPKYELCFACYANSPDREEKVEEAVETYFSNLKVKGFSPKTQHGIQIGSENRIADVVLTNENGSFVAIGECKGAGFVGDGREQLFSYLSATDTRFGVFANKVDSKHWEFYENRRRNRFDKIDCSKFEAEVVEGVVNRERLIDEIADLKSEIAGLENQKSELHTAIGEVSQTKHNLTECVSNLTQQIEALKNYKSELHEEIHQELNDLLEKKMQRLERPLSDLKIELQKRGIVNWFRNLFSKENK